VWRLSKCGPKGAQEMPRREVRFQAQILKRENLLMAVANQVANVAELSQGSGRRHRAVDSNQVLDPVTLLAQDKSEKGGGHP